MNLTGEVINDKYLILDQLGEGGASFVYNAVDQSNQTQVAVKILKENVTSSYIEDFIRFQREIEIISKLSHPYIIKVYDSGEYRNHPYMITEYLEGQSLADLLQNNQTPLFIETAIEIIKQISEALNYIHHHGVIHRDLKPGNIFLISKPQLQIKLLDFGVAYMMELEEIKDEREIVGTFGYMSPEASGILNRRIDERSDLYSLGVIWYHLLTGELPFKDKDVIRLLHSQAAVIPQRPGQINQRVPKVLEEMIIKLLEKDPDLRYQSASGLLNDLEKYRRGEREFQVGAGDQKMKLTYQTRLVGREEELEKLKSLVDQTLQGKGKICFITGEAGIGKSRLAEEIRGYVYERNGLFIWGRCLNHENKTPYQPFKDALDEFLRVFQQQQAEDALGEVQRLKDVSGDLGGIVIQLNPRMEQIIGKAKPLTPLEPERETQRFLMVTADFFRRLADRTGLCALFLDDLQWADEGSLNLLEELASKIATANLIVLGAYRDNEGGAGQGPARVLNRLKTIGAGFEEIKLKTFKQESLQRMITAILSEPGESAAQLGKFIFERSAGNPFFTIHLIREIVENEALQWRENSWKLDWDKLNKIPVSGNMVTLILKRIAGLTEAQNELLSKAAIIGREFEIELLSKLVNINRVRLVELVDEMLAMQLLEKSSERGKLIFAHDRIRDAFYQKLTGSERRKIHHEVAQIIEAAYPDHGTVIYELAHHFFEAGELEKTLEYVLPAAHQAKASHANEEAIKYYQKAIELLEHKGEKGGAEWIKANGDMVEVYLTAGKNNEAIAIAETLLPMLKQPLEKARTYKKIGMAYFKKGDWVNCEENSIKGLLLLDVKIPRTKPALILSLLRELIFHLLFSPLAGIFFRRGRKAGEERYREIIRTYYYLDHMYVFTDVNKFLYNTLKMLNIAEMKLENTKELAMCLTAYGIICTTIPWFGRAFRYYRKALAIGDEWGIAQTFHTLGRAYAWRGMNSESIAYYETSIQKYQAIGDLWEMAFVIQGLATAYLYISDYPKAFECFERYVEISRKINDEFGAVSGQSDSALGYIETGDFGKAQELLDQVITSGEVRQSLYTYCYTNIYAGYLALEKGDYDQAIVKLEEAKKVDEANQFAKEYTVMLYSLLAEAYLKRYQLEYLRSDYPAVTKERRKIQKLCKKALRKTRAWNNHYGAALRVIANFYGAAQKNRRAQKYFLKSIRQAQKTGRRFELAKTFFEYGLFLRTAKQWEQARRNWREAYDLFSEIGAGEYLKKFTNLMIFVDNNGQSSERMPSRERLGFERRMNTVLATSRYISSILDMEDLLPKIMDSAMELAGAERGLLLLYPETGESSLEVAAIRNVSDREFYGEHFGPSRSIIARIEEEKKPLLITDAMVDEEFQKQSSVVIAGIRSVIAAPIMVKDVMLGVLYLDNRLISGIFEEKDLQVLDLIANQAGVSIENARLYRKIRQYSQEIEKSRDEIAGWNLTLEQRVIERTEQLEVANRELKAYASMAEELAVSKERNRIARDMHDTLGHTLSVLVTLLESCNSTYEKDPQETRRFLAEAVKIARDGLSEVRRSVSGLLWREDSILDFINSFEKMIADFQLSGIKVDFSIEESLPYLSRTYLETIYRVCQEALTNSLKHGKATEVHILLRVTGGKLLKLYIFDNGCGGKSFNQHQGFGLKGMRQRVESLNGSIVFGSSGGRGFNIHIEIPIEG